MGCHEKEAGKVRKSTYTDMTSNPASNYHEVRDELLRRLREAAPGRVQILSGPRQVGKTTLLLEIIGERTGSGPLGAVG